MPTWQVGNQFTYEVEGCTVPTRKSFSLWNRASHITHLAFHCWGVTVGFQKNASLNHSSQKWLIERGTNDAICDGVPEIRLTPQRKRIVEHYPATKPLSHIRNTISDDSVLGNDFPRHSEGYRWMRIQCNADFYFWRTVSKTNDIFQILEFIHTVTGSKKIHNGVVTISKENYIQKL